jgi:hypothetical protein
MELTTDDFEGLSQDKQIKKLYDNQVKLEGMVSGMCEKIDQLLKSPWRMAQPMVKWGIGGAVIITGILKGWSPAECLKAVTGFIGG